MILSKIKARLSLNKKRKKWRNNNLHNYTIMKNVFPQNLVQVGRATYGSLFVHSNDDVHKLYIGNYCSIADEVAFLLSADHQICNISTYPFKRKITNMGKEGFSKGDIVIEDDVWIGYRSTILSGITIGQGAIVAAGSVVSKDVPPYAIVAGVPAKIVKYRFDQDTINELLKLDFSNLDSKTIECNLTKLYSPVDSEDLDWFPHRYAK